MRLMLPVAAGTGVLETLAGVMSQNPAMATFTGELVLSAWVLTSAATLFAIGGFSIAALSRLLGCGRFRFLGVLVLFSKKEFVLTSFKVTLKVLSVRQTECG